jgi:hypothetical protein
MLLARGNVVRINLYGLFAMLRIHAAVRRLRALHFYLVEARPLVVRRGFFLCFLARLSLCKYGAFATSVAKLHN